MNDWRVSGSESDSDLADDDAVDIGGIKMSSEKIRDMLKMVEKRKTLELDAVTGIRRKERKKRRNKERQKGHSPGKEEVSETASEIPSTISNVDLRDVPRSSLSAFDYFNDDPSVPDSSPSTLRRARAPKRDRKLAKLDGILSDLRREKKTCRDRSFQQEEEEDPWSGDLAGANPGHARTNSFSLCTSGNGGFPVDQLATHPAANNNGQPCSPELPGFDSDEDSDEASANSEANIKHRVLSQIIKVEKLLDAEGLS
ncbi:hypothetical protein EMCRGX_G024756 [Ephydatia muelleri]